MSSASLYNLQREGKEPRVEQSPQLLVQELLLWEVVQAAPSKGSLLSLFFPFLC